MTMLVSLDDGKAHLRVDHDIEDSDIALKIHAASAAVLNYLKAAGIADFVDSSGELPVDSSGVVEWVPYEVRAATLLMLGYLYKDRDNDAGHEYETGYLPRPVTALLYARRDPALA
jgi:hypothetical protein